MHRSAGHAPLKSAPLLAVLVAVAWPLSATAAQPFTVDVSNRDGLPLAGLGVYLEAAAAVPGGPPGTAFMDQVDLKFEPPFLIIQRGTEVTFRNSDMVSHHVYSFSSANRFQLPLYKGDGHAPVRFDHAGVVVLGCNIHDSMVGYILVVDTPYFSTTDTSGHAVFDQLTPGEYRLYAWGPGFTDTKPEFLGSVPIVQPQESISFRLDRPVPSMQSSGSSSLRWDDY